MQLIETEFQMEQAQGDIEKASLFAVDIETYNHASMNELGEVRLIQIGTPDDCYVFDMFQTGFPAFLKTLFADPARTKIFHYGIFDMSHLIHHYQVNFANTFCTYLASRVLSAGLTVRNSLKDLAKRYLDQELDKEEQASDWGGVLSPSQLAYAAKDVEILFPLHEKLAGILEEKRLEHVARLEFGLQQLMARMRGRGIPLYVHRMEAERDRIRSAFPPNMHVEQLVDDPKTKLPSPVMQQMLETYRLMRELETNRHHPELITQWRDFGQFFQKNVRLEILDYVKRPCQRVRFKGMWLPALSACAKDYRTREHIEDPAFLRTQNAAMLRAIGEKDHKAMEQHKYRIHDFLELYPGIRKWQERTGSTAVGKKPLRLPSGRIIHTRMFEPHRPDFYKQILVSCISDFIKTLMLVAFRNGGTVYAYDRDTQTLWGHLDDPGKWHNHIADAARFAFGRPLPDHFFSMEELD